MFVVVDHTISNPEKFWSEANRQKIGSLPSDLHVLQTFPNADGTRAVCLWQAESLNRVRQTVEELVGEVSRNECYAVEERNAMGLPATAPAHA
jgi:hypothetical protein